MQTSVRSVRVSENDSIGNGGKGLFLVRGKNSSSAVRASGVRGPRERIGDALLTTRSRSFVREVRERSKGAGTSNSSDSRPELGGVCGGVGGASAGTLRVTCRSSVTATVASDAISRASDEDRGCVVNTTKYGIALLRENTTVLGRVICADAISRH